VSEWNLKIIEEFRANEGRVGGMFEGAALLLLTTTGARSGRPHTTPLTYMADAAGGDRLLVFASNAGAPTHPAWYHNVLADPRVAVEVGTRSYQATALPLHDEERDRAYARQSELVPAYAEYQRQTTRVIPVVALYDAAHRADRAAAVGDHLTKVHADLRRELASIREEAASFFNGRSAERPGLGAQLHAHCLTVCDALSEHHTGEDSVFPRLRGMFPGLSPVLEKLRREHLAIARAKDDLRALLDGAEATDPVRFQAELDRLITELEEHFAYEEEQLVPLLNSIALPHPAAG
jgi:deazaflavin-dependent oxidoreductase (nitroreductase family)